MKNYYDILGLKPECSQEDIKKAYRKLSIKFHPDKNDGDEYFSEMFKQINEANEVLGNPSTRKEYDQKINIKNNDQNQGYQSGSSNQKYSNYKNNFDALYEKVKIYSKNKIEEQRAKYEYESAKQIPESKHFTVTKFFGAIALILVLFVIYSKITPSNTPEEITGNYEQADHYEETMQKARGITSKQKTRKTPVKQQEVKSKTYSIKPELATPKVEPKKEIREAIVINSSLTQKEAYVNVDTIKTEDKTDSTKKKKWWKKIFGKKEKE